MPYKITHFLEGGSIAKIFDNIKKVPIASIKVAIFIYDTRVPPLDIFQKFKPYKFKDSNFKTSYEDDENILIEFNVIKNGGPKYDDGTQIFLQILKKQPLAILVTNADSIYFEQIKQFFNKFYPFLSRIFLRSEDIKNLLNNVKGKSDYNIVVKNYVLKRYYVKKKIESTWEVIDYLDLFKKASQEFVWVDGIYIHLTKKIGEKDEIFGKVRVSRSGVLKYSRTDYTMIYTLFLKYILSEYMEKFGQVIMKKGRSLDNIEPHPVRFILNEEIFKDSKDAVQVTTLIKDRLRNWGYSILSQEGGLLYLTMHDYVSGGSYDLIITSVSEILIIPQTQVTSLSFNRILMFLTETYDGVVEDA